VIVGDMGGYVIGLDAELIGRACVILGGGRDKVDDAIDPSVGILIEAAVGEEVHAGDAILRIQYRDPMRLQEALPLLNAAVRFGEQPVPKMPLVIDEVL
jgi:pyrimidine-nucleoside phosphorylase